MTTEPEDARTDPVSGAAEEMSTARTQKMTSPAPAPGRPANPTRVGPPVPVGPGPTGQRAPMSAEERAAALFRVPEARPGAAPPRQPPRPAGPPAAGRPAGPQAPPASGKRLWYQRVGPGSLAVELAAVRPGQLDDVTTRAVGNWVSHEEATARLAEARAEPHLHEHLERAGVVGRRQGWLTCAVVLWPLAVLLLLIAVWILGG